jgi:hypothetical protein
LIAREIAVIAITLAVAIIAAVVVTMAAGSTVMMAAMAAVMIAVAVVGAVVMMAVGAVVVVEIMVADVTNFDRNSAQLALVQLVRGGSKLETKFPNWIGKSKKRLK